MPDILKKKVCYSEAKTAPRSRGFTPVTDFDRVAPTIIKIMFDITFLLKFFKNGFIYLFWYNVIRVLDWRCLLIIPTFHTIHILKNSTFFNERIMMAYSRG
jgi:hypothetical protein